nr:MAG TPA: hypothetical protein [Caudoviricetes sp.]
MNRVVPAYIMRRDFFEKLKQTNGVNFYLSDSL